MKLRISVYMEGSYPPGPGENVQGNLRLEQDFEVGTMGFLEICRILGQFDELGKKIARDKKP